MQKETMTVHKALTELKLIDKKIEAARQDAILIFPCEDKKDKIQGKDKKEYIEKVVTPSYNKLNDLINRKIALKKAILKSNSVTEVIIEGKKYTVAEAIWLNSNGMEDKKEFLTLMSVQYNRTVELSNKTNEKVEEKAEAYVKALAGENATVKDIAAYEDLRQKYIEQNKCSISDPLNLLDKIEKLEKEINDFEIMIDSALSVSNAITTIEVEY